MKRENEKRCARVGITSNINYYIVVIDFMVIREIVCKRCLDIKTKKYNRR